MDHGDQVVACRYVEIETQPGIFSTMKEEDDDRSEDEESANLLEDGSERNHSTSFRQTLEVFLLKFRRYLLLMVNVVAWYTTNGMNGIAMQSFASIVWPREEGNPRPYRFLSLFCATTSVTALQLLAGAALGRLALYLFARMSPKTGSTGKSYDVFSVSMRYDDLALSALHCMGSVSTNNGFMFGSAAMIQIIKLFEPFETLFLTRLILADERKSLSYGVVASMTLTTGAAISLIKSRPTKPDPKAIIFAIVSGLALSSRNVLQRRQHAMKSHEEKPKHAQVLQEETQANMLERAFVQFTTLSFEAGVLAAIQSILLALVTLTMIPPDQRLSAKQFTSAISWQLLTWHPLYNLFSMITLSFCSALTHSLLNAGKRVFAIVMAIIWFHESFSSATAIGLVLITIGGCWYTVETKRKPGASSMTEQVKPVIVLLLLTSYYATIAPPPLR